MDTPRDCHSTEIKRQISWYHLYVESKKWHKWSYLQNRNSHWCRKQTYGIQGGMG